MSDKNKIGKPFLVLLTSIIILVILSIAPLLEWSGGFIKEYNLFSEIIDDETNSIESVQIENVFIDPLLVEIIDNKISGQDSSSTVAISANAQDTIITLGGVSASDTTDTIVTPLPTPIAPRVGDMVIIEDYSDNRDGLFNLKRAIANRDNLGRPVRIAFLGDSYIEGDIFSQHVREGLQNEYGGSGVGYVNMHSEFPGFRKSIKQRSSGWSTHDFINGNISRKNVFIAQQYFSAQGNAKSTYTGTDYANHLSNWERSKFVFISPASMSISLKIGETWENYDIAGATDSVQCIDVSQPTSEFGVKVNSTNFIGLGVWLEGNNGITVDCMSTRGSSGLTLTRVSKDLTKQLSNYIEYDLIILEYGINAMSTGQTDFSAYAQHIGKVIEHLRDCYPNSDILLMGIGDRGEKRNGVVKTMKNVPNMIKAQRGLAMESKCLFWDTREAMGGEDAAAKWANNKPAYVNKDYIHLSYQGGRVLANEFVKSLIHAINE